MAAPVNWARHMAVWFLTLRKRDIFRAFLVYVFLRHVPRGIEAPPHYLTGRQIAPQSLWILRVFNYFVADPVRSVAILIEACVRREFDERRIHVASSEVEDLVNDMEEVCEELEKLVQDGNSS